MLYELLVSGELLPHISISLYRAIAGFFLGSVTGIIVGLLMGWFRSINSIADIPFNMIRAVPKAALAPLFILWFGIGELPKILLISMSSFIYCVINVVAGFKSVDITMIKVALSLGAKDKDILKEVIVPAISPMIFAALRLGIVVSFILLVIVEMIAAQKGLGYYIMMTQRLYYTDKMFAALIVITVFAYLLDLSIRKIEKHSLRWHKGISNLTS
jgi:ABC-type nitrate/sulfonate/bicarbonate transport system permease component